MEVLLPVPLSPKIKVAMLICFSCSLLLVKLLFFAFDLLLPVGAAHVSNRMFSCAAQALPPKQISAAIAQSITVRMADLVDLVTQDARTVHKEGEPAIGGGFGILGSEHRPFQVEVHQKGVHVGDLLGDLRLAVNLDQLGDRAKVLVAGFAQLGHEDRLRDTANHRINGGQIFARNRSLLRAKC
jgi:hypothetical protein